MRIAQLANFVGPASGGMKTALAALGAGYAAAGCERLLVVPGPVDSVVETPDGRVVQLRAPRVGGGYRLIVEPWRVVDVLEEFGPDSIELSDKLTLLPVARWARRTGVRSVLFSHERLDDMFALRSGLDRSARVSVALLNRVLVRSVDEVVVTSRYAEEEFAGLVAPQRVPLGVDLETFRPAPDLSPAGDRLLRLVHVGRLSREKSPHLAELQVVAGEAPVTFHGYVDDRAELARRIAAADVSLSVCPGETFGLAVLEALACGTPVVTADRGGARELVDAGSGAWAAPDPIPLAAAVLSATSVSRAGARRRAELFPWAATVERMLAVHAAPRAVSATA